MSLTRYYILENDATTAGGIVQATTNPIIFNVGGKKQSCIGDDVWCPACQSMGKIVPTGPRLSFSLGGAMPALNDDLCLCKCTPPPKLINSQTSFKEIIDDNRLAEYQQAREQYRQSKLQNNLNSQINNDFPEFTVHFRRNDSYRGEYGFDWLRDEYVYDVGGKQPQSSIAEQGTLISAFIKQYTTYQNKPVSVIDEFASIRADYIPAWLNLFPKNDTNGIHANGVYLHLEIEQDPSNNTNPLTDDGAVLSFECSPQLEPIADITLADYLANAERQIIQLTSADKSLIDKHTYRYSNKSLNVNVLCNQALSEVGYIKVYAKKNGVKKQVGLLCICPNNITRKAVIQPVLMRSSNLEPKGEHGKLQLYPTHEELSHYIRHHFLHQVLVQVEVKPYQEFRLHELYNNPTVTEEARNSIVTLIRSHKQTLDKVEPIERYLAGIDRQVNDDFMGIFTEQLRSVYAKLTGDDPKINQSQTYVFFTDYYVNSSQGGDVAGRAERNVPDEQEIIQCREGNQCNHWKNTAVIFSNTGEDNIRSLLHTTAHELGHSFGLAHTYLLESQKEDYENGKMEKFENPYYLRRAKTDNIMDYTFVNDEQTRQQIDNPYTGRMFSLFKWQWDKIHNDINLTKSIGVAK